MSSPATEVSSVEGWPTAVLTNSGLTGSSPEGHTGTSVTVTVEPTTASGETRTAMFCRRCTG